MLHIRRAPLLLVTSLLVGCPHPKDKPVTPQKKEAAARQQLLEELVAAPDPRTFSERLRIYGPIEAPDVPYLSSEARSFRAQHRKNAVTLLSLARTDDALVALRKLVADTDDVFVYAVALERLLETGNPGDQSLAAARPKLLQKALADADPKVVAAALRAGVAAKLPGIEAELDKRLSGSEPEVRDAVLDALADAGPGAVVGKLKSLALQPPASLINKISLFQALSKSNDPTVAEVFRAVVKDRARGGDLASGINLSHSRQPWLQALLLEWLHSSDIELQLFAFGCLSRWDERPIQREAVALCLQTLTTPPAKTPAGWDTDLISQCCRYLGERSGNDRAFFGSDDARRFAEARTFAQKWLTEHP